MTQTSKAFNVEEILDNVPLLSSLNNTQKKQLSKELVQIKFSKGDDLMKEGEEGDSFVIIVEGKVEVKSSKAGHLAFLQAGDYAGEQALLKSTVRNASLTAVESTTCLVCNKKNFDKIKKSVKFAKREGKRLAFLTEVHEEKLEKVSEKSEETIEWILNCVNDNLLFLKLDRTQRVRIISRMKLIDVPKGDILIQQGDKNARTFYVCEQGSFDILVDGVKVGHYKRGGCFGELALLYNSPRAATIVATTDSKAWEVSRNVFRNTVAQTSREKSDANIEFMKQVDLFKPYLSNELLLICDGLEENKYNKGSIIIKEGDDAEKFYIIKEGSATWKKSNGESGDLEPKSYFGERALRTKEKRAATVIAKTDLILLEMKATDFEALLGPVIDIVDDKIQQYQKMTDRFDELRKQSSESIVNNNYANEDGIDNKKNKITTEKNDKKEELPRDKVCDLKDLVTVGVLGKGAFGLVTLVQDPTTKKSYALKAIKKHQIVELVQQAHILSEKRVMEKMHNKFLVNLHRTYKDKLRVYFLLDVCLGGELFTILRQRRYFDEPTAKFFTACVVEAFAYMHAKQIIYRDLKPENLVLDSDGYLKVTDFGFAKEIPDKTFTLCGTPDYLAPEIVTGQGHGRAVDWWTLGILIYEMLASFPPFFDDEPIETYRKIIRGHVKFPRYFSAEARDLIRGLLRNKPTKRLGILRGGADNIRKHAWFSTFEWDKLCDGSMKAPIINKVKNNQDLSNFINSEEDQQDEQALPVSSADDFGEEF